MKIKDFNWQTLILFSGGALAYSILVAIIFNLISGVRFSMEEGIVVNILFGFIACVVFAIGCVIMYVKVANISIGRGILGTLVLAPITFFIIHSIINTVLPLMFLSGPDYNEVLWVYSFMIAFISNVICLILMKKILNRIVEKQELMDRITGRKK